MQAVYFRLFVDASAMPSRCATDARGQDAVRGSGGEARSSNILNHGTVVAMDVKGNRRVAVA